MGRMFFRFDWEHHGVWLMFGLMALGCAAIGGFFVFAVWAISEQTT